MKQKIKIPINNVIIKKENIIEIAKFIFMQENRKDLIYRIKFKNEQEIESDDITIFEDRKFEEYEIDYIYMNYWDKDYENNIELYIYNYDTVGHSHVEIKSSNLNWIAIVEKNIKEKISFCDKQSKINCIFEKFYIGIILSLLMSAISAVIFGVFIGKIANMGLEQKKVVILLCYLVFSIIYSQLFRNLEKAFPKVEISISDKNNSSKKKRNNIILISTSLILPIILNLIYDFIKLAIK